MANKIEFVVLADVKNIEKNLSSASKQFQAFGSKMTKFVTLPLLAGAAGFVKLAGDADETRNKFKQVMGDMTERADNFTKTLSKGLGRSRTELEDGLASFQAFAKGLGFGSKEAFDLSSRLQELSLDFASFNNVSDDEALQRFISAMSGSSEVVDRFGINLKQANLDLKLQELGLADSTAKANENQKAMARLAIIEESLGAQGAIGDALRTQESFANQLKRLQSSAKDLGISLGQILIPAATKLVVITTSLLNKFLALDEATQKQIVSFAGIVALVGPVSLGISAIISGLISVSKYLAIVSVFKFAGLNTSVVILAKNVGVLSTVLTTVGAVGVAAFAGWNIGKVIADVTGLGDAITNLALKLNVFGNKEAEKSLKLEEELNRLAVERKRLADEERFANKGGLSQQLEDQVSHEEQIRLLKEETKNFLQENDAELRSIAEANNEEDFIALIEKFENERNALLEHLNLKLSILDENGILEKQMEQDIADRKLKINEKYHSLLEHLENQRTKNQKKSFTERLKSVQDFSSSTVEILRAAGAQTKAIEIVNAIIQQQGALSKAWNSAPFPLNLPAVALTAVKTGIILSVMQSASYAVGSTSVPKDMTANIHKGEIIVPKTFSEGLRSGELSLSGGGEGGQPTIDLRGSTFNGINESLVEDMFKKASEMIKNNTLSFRGA